MGSLVTVEEEENDEEDELNVKWMMKTSSPWFSGYVEASFYLDGRRRERQRGKERK